MIVTDFVAQSSLKFNKLGGYWMKILRVWFKAVVQSKHSYSTKFFKDVLIMSVGIYGFYFNRAFVSLSIDANTFDQLCL